MSSWTMHHGDAFTVLPTLPAGSIDCLVTDPPYNSGGRTNAERANQSARSKYVSGDAKHDLATFAGDNKDQRSYTWWLTVLLAESLRASTDGASCLVFTDFRQLPATSDALQAAGWTWRGVVPWIKPNTRPCKNGFKRSAEYVLWGTNGEPFRHEVPIYLDGWLKGSQPLGKNRKHITQKPVEIMRELVKVCRPGGTVLDPCAGAGTTGVASLLEGRKFVGLELTEHYHQVASERLAATERELAEAEQEVLVAQPVSV